jgi:hypothetical protein
MKFFGPFFILNNRESGHDDFRSNYSQKFNFIF